MHKYAAPKGEGAVDNLRVNVENPWNFVRLITNNYSLLIGYCQTYKIQYSYPTNER